MVRKGLIRDGGRKQKGKGPRLDPDWNQGREDLDKNHTTPRQDLDMTQTGPRPDPVKTQTRPKKR